MNSMVRTAGLVSASAPSPISDIHKHLPERCDAASLQLMSKVVGAEAFEFSSQSCAARPLNRSCLESHLDLGLVGMHVSLATCVPHVAETCSRACPPVQSSQRRCLTNRVAAAAAAGHSGAQVAVLRMGAIGARLKIWWPLDEAWYS